MNKRGVTVAVSTAMAVTMLSGLTRGEHQADFETLPGEAVVTQVAESMDEAIEPVVELVNVVQAVEEPAEPLPTYNLLVRGAAGETVEVTQDGLLVATTVLNHIGEGVCNLSPGTYVAVGAGNQVQFTFRTNASLADVIGGTFDSEMLIME